MGNLNKVILEGHAGKDPELKYTTSGMAICSFSLATSDKKKDGAQVTQWHNVQFFQKQAEIVKQYIVKGSHIVVIGKIEYQSWEDKDGNKRNKTVINCNEFYFLGKKEGGSNTSPQNAIPPQDDFGQDPSPTDSDPNAGLPF